MMHKTLLFLMICLSNLNAKLGFISTENRDKAKFFCYLTFNYRTLRIMGNVTVVMHNSFTRAANYSKSIAWLQLWDCMV